MEQQPKRILDMCKAFVSKDALKPALCGINYREGCVIATDGFNLIKLNEVVNPKCYGTYDLKGNLIDEKYPDCLDMIKTTFKRSYSVDKADLLKAIESLSKIHDFGWLKFTFEAGELTILTENIDSFFSIQGSAKLICTPKNDTSNEKFNIAFLASSLIPILKVFKKYGGGSHITIQTNENQQPISISNLDFTCLCVPIYVDFSK